VPDALDDGVRHRTGRSRPIFRERAQALDCAQQRLVRSLTELTASEVGACAPASEAASLTVGDVGETVTCPFAAAEQKPLDRAHVRLDASSSHSDSHRTISRVPERDPDRQLVARAAGGDLEAFGELVRTYERRVASVLYRLLDDRGEVEEATQDVFVQAWRNLHRFRGEAQVFTWLYRIAINEALMRRRRKQPSVQELDDRHAAAPDPEPGLRDAIVDALAALPFEHRAAVVLRDIEGLTNAEVAEALGTSVAAAKSRIHRGRMQIRDALAQWERS
jgi:RNA polymerase sigma-70 factor, ECF subfamily